MIASLRGALLESGPDSVVIEAGGVGYAVTITAAAQRALPPLGASAFLLVHTHTVQDGPTQLFGFADAEERRVFETLLSVQGVGPKVALAILSSLPIGELVRGGPIGWTAWVLTPEPKLPTLMRLKESRRVPMWNGPIECRLFRFDLVAGSARNKP